MKDDLVVQLTFDPRHRGFRYRLGMSIMNVGAFIVGQGRSQIRFVPRSTREGLTGGEEG